MKRAVLAVAKALGVVFGVIPFALRRGLIGALILVESRIGRPGDSLKRLFALADDLDRLLNERATAYGEGVNPKHRLTRYHDFFVERIPAGSRVLDIGCGIGAVARSIAGRVPGATVAALDNDPQILAQARALPCPPNLRFIEGTGGEGGEPPSDVLVLSNVLEHVDERVALLRRLIAFHHPRLVLIRVPLFERHWHMPLRRELGVSYLSDPTHFIEHTQDEFAAEMTAAGLTITETILLWGEIWAACEVSP